MRVEPDRKELNESAFELWQALWMGAITPEQFQAGLINAIAKHVAKAVVAEVLQPYVDAEVERTLSL